MAGVQRADEDAYDQAQQGAIDKVQSQAIQCV